MRYKQILFFASSYYFIHQFLSNFLSNFLFNFLFNFLSNFLFNLDTPTQILTFPFLNLPPPSTTYTSSAILHLPTPAHTPYTFPMPPLYPLSPHCTCLTPSLHLPCLHLSTPPYTSNTTLDRAAQE